MADKYSIYTDGGCNPNPGRGGYAAIIINNGSPIYLVGSEDNATNQKMELKAVILGLRFIERPSDITIYSDSAYVCNCFKNKWYEIWERNGGKNSKNKEVINIYLWKTLLELVRFHKSVEFVKVKGHSTNMLNNKCDELASDIISFKSKIDSL